MSTCSISAICVTYGRTAQLQEAIAAFEAQDIKSPVELLILNTFGGQKLSLGWNSQVRIINLPIRLNSLGESRNRAIAESNGDVIVIVDEEFTDFLKRLEGVGLSYVIVDLIAS